MLALAVAFVLGILGSVLAVLVLAHWFAPRLEFKVAELDPIPDCDDPVVQTYYRDPRIEITAPISRLRSRPVMDLRIYAQLRIPKAGLIELPTSIEFLPRLRPGGSRNVALQMRNLSSERIALARCHGRLRAHDDVDLRGILTARPDACVRLYVTGSDSFLGARRIFASPDYIASDLYPGQ